MEKNPIENLPIPEEDKSEQEKEKLVFRAGMSPTESNKKIGPIRSHLYNYAFAKGEAEKGKDSKIIFRVDDTDKEKHTKEKAEDIFRFFTDTLGFRFDITPHNAEKEIGQSVFQSERQEIYRGYLEELFDKHVAFIDKESGLVLFDIEKFINQYEDTLEINDLLRGKIKFKLEENLRRGQNFFPLMRSDKSALYHLASVVDDKTFGVTHVVRGQDKLSIAEFQEMVRVSLGLEPKKYLHTPMLLDAEGKMLKGAVKFDDFIKQGIVPHALISYMISSGYGNPKEMYPSLEKFIESFDYSKIHKNSGKFDIGKLENINDKLIKKTSPEVYLDSILLYLAKVSEEQILEKLKIDQELKNILISFRRDPKESLDVIKNILEPQYEAIREDTRGAIQKLLLEIGKGGDNFPSAKMLELSQKAVYEATGWILVGKYTFPSITQVFEYLKTNELLNHRVILAKKIFDASF
jgi:glutamyl/glutaminyl-tRNA synthetase